MSRRENKIALSIDLDDWYHTPAITGSSFSIYKTVDDFFKEWKDEFDFITEPTLRLIKFLNEKDIQATFFVIADQIEQYPKIVKALKESEHEIACHSLHHQVPFDNQTKELIQTKEDWNEDLVKAKEILEDTFEREVIGYRAPGGYIANWMIDYLIEAGFKYDSSISYNSLYNKSNIELKNIPDYPYFLNEENFTDKKPNTTLMEFPWAVYNFFGYRIPMAGAFFFRVFGYNIFKYVINQNLKKHDTMFYIHSLDFSEEEIPLNNFKNRPFYWINKGEKCWKKFGMLVDYFENHFVNYKHSFNDS